MIVLVTGLMRTGTSLISKQLHLMGVPMGTLMRFPLAQENGQDDWEDVAFTDLMLHRVREFDIRPKERFLGDIRKYVEQRQSHSYKEEVWGMKSPFALPFVEDIRHAVNDDLKVIVTTRDVAETYDSLHKQTRLASVKLLQSKLHDALPSVRPDLVIDIKESWSSPDSVGQKLKALIRS